MLKRFLVLGVLLLPLLVCSVVFASVDKPITVSASVTSSSSFDVKVYKSTSSTTYDFTTNYYPNMNFGTLVHAVSGDSTSALTASNHFMALVTANNNTGTSYRVQYTGAPLKHTDGSTTLSNDAFTVVGGAHYNTDGSVATSYVAGINTSKKSAGDTTTYNVYTSKSNGASDIFRMYFGITGNPTDAVGNKSLISPTQKAGSYSSTVKITFYQ